VMEDVQSSDTRDENLHVDGFFLIPCSNFMWDFVCDNFVLHVRQFSDMGLA